LNSSTSFCQAADLDPARLPCHVAMIMDGNGRWGKKHLLSRIKGHKKGTETVRRIVRTSRELGIRYLTRYAFSTENWQRPATEISALMKLLDSFLKSEQKEMMENNIRLNAIGQIHRLPENVCNSLQSAMSATERNDGMTLSLALSYGARAEIVDMVKQIVTAVKEKRISEEAITESLVAGYLQTAGIPDPDLLIRTGGDSRVSNFLLWQIAYAELFITDTFWPDFGREEYKAILSQFQKRERRFGKI
jgi:undecaprenyl diphosphate synthase